MQTRLVKTFDADPAYTFVQDSQDVETTLERIGVKDDTYASLFVKRDAGDDLVEVWGLEASTPWIYKTAWRLL